jgi:UPF0716 protein FxsA
MRPLLRYPARLAALYLLVELVAVILLVRAFGWAWTLLVLLATFVVGVLLAGTQLKGQLRALRRAPNVSRGVVTDGVLVGLGAFLVVLPGVVTTTAGVLMLAPPTRGAMRPLAETMLTRRIDRRLGAVNLSAFRGPGAGRGDYIDGEVVEGEIVDGDVVDGKSDGGSGGASYGGGNLPIVR